MGDVRDKLNILMTEVRKNENDDKWCNIIEMNKDTTAGICVCYKYKASQVVSRQFMLECESDLKKKNHTD